MRRKGASLNKRLTKSQAYQIHSVFIYKSQNLELIVIGMMKYVFFCQNEICVLDSLNFNNFCWHSWMFEIVLTVNYLWFCPDLA